MKNLGRAAITILGLVLAGSAIFFTVGVVLPWLSGVILEVPWVASGIIFVLFLVGVVTVIPRRGWSPEGTLLLMGIVIVGVLFDGAGNPIFNAPYEALFLEPGERLQGVAVVERIGGETHISSEVSVVDSDGNFVRNTNWFLLALYRAAIYFIFYSVLLTISGFFPKSSSRNKNKVATQAK